MAKKAMNNRKYWKQLVRKKKTWSHLHEAEVSTASPKENPDNEKEYEIIEEKKLARDIKKQCANDKQLPKAAITKQNVITTNIATTPKEKTTARWHISERRLGTTEQIQSKYNKEKAQKVQERDGDDKDSCPKCKKYVKEGVKCE